MTQGSEEYEERLEKGSLILLSAEESGQMDERYWTVLLPHYINLLEAYMDLCEREEAA
jgi:hypothetical protein